MFPARLHPLPLRQRDGVTCGPTVAIVGSALLDDGYAEALSDADWFHAEQGRLHKRLNRIWPRALGTTPAAMAHALSGHSAVPYRWRVAHGRSDRLLDVRESVLLGWPVAMLVGRVIPRHWVLLVAWRNRGFDCYEPSSGENRRVTAENIRHGTMTGVGYPTAFAFVLPSQLSRTARR